MGNKFKTTLSNAGQWHQNGGDSKYGRLCRRKAIDFDIEQKWKCWPAANEMPGLRASAETRGLKKTAGYFRSEM